jgi:type I restriction enzyme S subunit
MTARAKTKPATEVEITPDELPEGWAITVADVAGQWLTGGTPSRKVKEYFGGSIPWVKSGDLNDGVVTSTEEKITKAALQNSAAKVLPAGTVSMALYGATIGKLGLLDIQAATNQACANCIVNPNCVDRRYLFFYLLHERRALIDAGQGGAQPNLTNQIVRDWPFMLAPRAEQPRIVAKTEDLLHHGNASRDRLTKIPKILKRFRQAVLAAACSGRLTEEWRDKHSELKSGTQLLEPILAKLQKTKIPDEEDPIDPPEIPEPWVWSRCEDLCQPERPITYGVIKLGPPAEEGVPTLRSSDVRWLSIEEDHVKRISRVIAANYSRTFLRGGELLVTVRGSLGGVAVVPPQMKGFNISREVAMIPLRTKLEANFFAYAIASTWSQRWLSEVPKDVAYTGVNIRDLKRLPLPVPPSDEQKEIVRRVEALFKLADTIEKCVEAATKRAEKLTQAILAKAFRGELVPTEAEIARREGREYEPASALLARIHAERPRAEVSATFPQKLRRSRTDGK